MSDMEFVAVGIPREIKPGEQRVAGLPSHVRDLRAAGCPVLVQRSAGAGAGFADEEYEAAGAELVDSIEEVYARADLIWKVKEILPEEYTLLRRGQTVFTYLHPAPRPPMVYALRDAGTASIAYEDMVDAQGRRPLLAPMSRMAGAGGVAMAAQFSQSRYGGCGKLLFHTEGTERMKMVILGGGVAGRAAASAALGAGTEVTILDVGRERLEDLKRTFPAAKVLASTPETLRRLLPTTDVLLNCTYWMPGDPHLVTRDMVASMRAGSLIVDVSADPHGAVETSEATTHDDPVRVIEGVVHYCVPNIPALFARSASQALSEAVWPHLRQMAVGGVERAVRESAMLRSGLVTWRGHIVGEALGRILGVPALAPDDVLRG